MSNGRKPGAKAKMPKALREMAYEALDKLGGTQWLIEQARKDPRTFMHFIKPLLPRELAVDVRGELSFEECLAKMRGPEAEEATDDAE